MRVEVVGYSVGAFAGAEYHMNRRDFVMSSVAATAAVPLSGWSSTLLSSAAAAGEAKVAVLVVDTDRVTARIDKGIYGQFLEHINHSVEDGLFAEQIRGAGFEGRDFETYWTSFGPPGAARVVETAFERGTKSVRITAGGERSGIRQGRVFVESGR